VKTKNLTLLTGTLIFISCLVEEHQPFEPSLHVEHVYKISNNDSILVSIANISQSESYRLEGQCDSLYCYSSFRSTFKGVRLNVGDSISITLAHKDATLYKHLLKIQAQTQHLFTLIDSVNYSTHVADSIVLNNKYYIYIEKRVLEHE